MATLTKYWLEGKGICTDLLKLGVKKDSIALYGDEGGKRVKLFDQQCEMLDKLAAGDVKELKNVPALAAAATANSMALVKDMKAVSAFLALNKKDKPKDKRLAEEVTALERSFATFSREATTMTDKFKKLAAASDAKSKASAGGKG